MSPTSPATRKPLMASAAATALAVALMVAPIPVSAEGNGGGGNGGGESGSSSTTSSQVPGGSGVEAVPVQRGPAPRRLAPVAQIRGINIWVVSKRQTASGSGSLTRTAQVTFTHNTGQRLALWYQSPGRLVFIGDGITSCIGTIQNVPPGGMPYGFVVTTYVSRTKPGTVLGRSDPTMVDRGMSVSLRGTAR